MRFYTRAMCTTPAIVNRSSLIIEQSRNHTCIPAHVSSAFTVFNGIYIYIFVTAIEAIAKSVDLYLKHFPSFLIIKIFRRDFLFYKYISLLYCKYRKSHYIIFSLHASLSGKKIKRSAKHRDFLLRRLLITLLYISHPNGLSETSRNSRLLILYDRGRDDVPATPFEVSTSLILHRSPE